ncbi:hypothetical protein P3F83_12800 [Mycobacteroides immunogenum]|uniref:hypothetical protein n=1 Tax=Mycobacteroides immunogenum TaxID=83262 RepID=UPI0025B75620|nr:hypothetical protein [Mycobacteroides immunogenum]WJR36144.1 hypothetical protein P3F83_12800 [Mycobacteroides immunogenum]
MDVPRCALSALTESLSAPPQRPSRPPSPAADTSTPIGRAAAGFYLAFEAVDDSDRLREAANWVGSQQAPESDSRQKYLALATAITKVEQIRRHAGRTLRDIAATASNTAARLTDDTGLSPDINDAIKAAVRHESVAVCERAVRMINHQTRLVLDLDEVTAAMTVDDWLTSHRLTD